MKINGQAGEWLSRQKTPELMVEFYGPADLPGRRPDAEASRTYRFDPALLKAGDNVVEITNGSGVEVEVLSVNLGLWQAVE